MSCYSTNDIGGCACSCNVTFHVTCSGSNVDGAMVTVKDLGGTEIDSGTTDSSGLVTLDVGTAGTYEVIADGGSPACSPGYDGEIELACNGTYSIPCCGCPTTICVTGCPSGAAVVGASVTIKSGGTTVATGTTDATGCVTLDCGHAGSYEVVVSAAGYRGFDGTLSLSCEGTKSIKLQAGTSAASITVTVHGCCSAVLPGALVTLSDGQSCTTGSGGTCTFNEANAGTYTYTITADRFVTYTGSVTISGCATTTTNVSVTLSPATGYVCGVVDASGHGSPYPVPTTLHLTDSVYGSTTLTWNGTSAWTGTLAASFAGGCGCPSASFTISYTLSSCGGLSLTWTSAAYAQCVTSAFVITYACPYNGALTNCAAVGGSGYIYQASTCGTMSISWTKPDTFSSPPYDATFNISACACADDTFHGYWTCGDLRLSGQQCVTQTLPWNGGGTITITE